MTDGARQQRILIVEDETRTADTVALYLRHGGYDVSVRHDGQKGLDLALDGGFDLIILDWMLPGLPGPEICRRIRQQSDVLILMLTARVAENEKLHCFELGVDDYVTKPFSPREVLVRVNAMLRRAPATNGESQVVRVGCVVINVDERSVAVRGESVELTPAEFAILARMGESPGRVFSRARLLEVCDRDALERTVDVHIKNLRKKIEEDRGNPTILLTVFGAGYKLVAVDG